MLLIPKFRDRQSIVEIMAHVDRQFRDDLLLKYYEQCRRTAAWYSYAKEISGVTPEREERKNAVLRRLRSELMENIGELYDLYTSKNIHLGPTWKNLFRELVEKLSETIG